MSSENQDTPPKKLSLSRDKHANGETEKKAPPPAMKLKRKSDIEKQDTPTQETAEISTAPKTQEPPKDKNKEDFDPKNPFGDIIKDQEIKKPKRPPPELLGKPQPRIDDGSATKVEEAIKTLNDPKNEDVPEDTAKSSFLVSIVVILLLLSVLASAGYGIWKVLQTPEEEIAETEETGSKSPIQRAKDVVAQVNSANAAAENEVESFTGGASPSGLNNSENIVATPKPPPKTAQTGSNQQMITEYLSTVHIGGMRKGNRQMIILDTVSYQAGDIVQQESGLKFDGFRDGKPAFRDKNGIVYLKSF